MENLVRLSSPARVFVILALVVTSTAAASQTAPGSSSKTGKKALVASKTEKAGLTASSAAELSQASAVGSDYVIGIEDVLAINVWREPELSRSVVVRPDGKIALPLVGEMRASGSTPRELETVLSQQWRAYLSNPVVTVMVAEVRSRKFNILGEVLRPGTYPMPTRLTVLDAIAMAGGFREFAKVKDIYVLRLRSEGVNERIPFNYRKVIKGRDFGTQNVQLESRDTIIVP